MKRILPFRLSAASAWLAVVGLHPATGLAKDAGQHLVASWAASPASNKNPFVPSDVSIRNQTVRQSVTLSKGGRAVRLTFSNEFGTSPLHIGAASVAYRDASGVTRRVAVTFSGARSTTISPGAPVVSDIAALAVADGARLEIRTFFPTKTPVTTVHEYSLEKVDVSQPGDFTDRDTLPGATPLLVSGDPRLKGQSSARPFLAEIDVVTTVRTSAIVALGDSITDGAGSTPGADRRWPDNLARFLNAKKLPFAVINQGISGNQVLADGLGVSAVARLDRDVLSKPGVSTVIVMEGINDIGFSGNMVPGYSRTDVISAEELIAGYGQLIARAHANGLRVIGATMTPFEGSPAYTAQKEAVRKAGNDWIRTSGAFDAIIDFDAVLREPGKGQRLQVQFDSGDHILHRWGGYRAMAAAIDVSVLHQAGSAVARKTL